MWNERHNRTRPSQNQPRELPLAAQRGPAWSRRPSGSLVERRRSQSLPLPRWSAIPTPCGGGNLHNKVVYHAMKALNDPAWGLGWPVLRFNFRGTGLSQGTHDGQAEAGDVLAALDWLENEYKLPARRRRLQLWRGHGAAAPVARLHRPAPTSARSPLSACPLKPTATTTAIPASQDCTIPKLFLSGDQRPVRARRAAGAGGRLRRRTQTTGAPSPAPITFLPVNSSRCSPRSPVG